MKYSENMIIKMYGLIQKSKKFTHYTVNSRYIKIIFLFSNVVKLHKII